MFRLKVQRIGDALAVVLPKEVVARLDLKDGDTLLMADMPDGSVKITPRDAVFDAQMQAAREGIAKYGSALWRLAEEQ